MEFPSSQEITRHIDYLCRKLGCRFTGTPAGHKGAQYIAAQLKNYGVRVRLEEFDALAWDYQFARLKTPHGRIECLPVSYTASTPKGGMEGELAVIEGEEDLNFKIKKLEGKIGLYFGDCDFGNRPEGYKKLMYSGLKGLIMLWHSFVTPWPIAIGLAPAWIKHGRLPMVSVSYEDACALLSGNVSRVRLEIKSSIKKVKSCNVIGEIPGMDPADESVIVCGHHDSVPDSPGAFDNASGTVAVLELARMFRSSRPGRTLKFVVFGAEEQLSLGAVAYARAHARELGKTVFVLNTDDVGAILGKNRIFISGPLEVQNWIRKTCAHMGYAAETVIGANPYGDQFPFNVFGVPSAWFYRPGCIYGQPRYHSREDTADKISVPAMVDMLKVESSLLARLANDRALPFKRTIPVQQQKLIRKYARDLYDMG